MSAPAVPASAVPAPADIALADSHPHGETQESVTPLSRVLLCTMAAACAMGIANLYYAQPLLPQIARALGVTPSQVGWLPMLTQAGFALGVFLLAPLGDVMERRRLILAMTGLVSATLLLSAAAPSLAVLAILSLATGAFCVISTLVMPFAVILAGPRQRGATVGSISGAMLLGVLLSRSLSGTVGQFLGWRSVYLLAALAMAALGFTLKKLLPESRPAAELPYGQLLGSMAKLFREYAPLRYATANGFLLYAALSAFWATLSFFVSGPAYHYGPALAGAFGLVGATSAMGAPYVGRLADKHGARTLVAVATATMATGFALLWFTGHHLAGLIAGIVLLDVAAQAATISNQSTVYSLNPAAQSRMYTVYRAMYSLGGSMGALLGTQAWSHWGWAGVCSVGLGLLCTAGLLHVFQHSNLRIPGRNNTQLAMEPVSAGGNG